VLDGDAVPSDALAAVQSMAALYAELSGLDPDGEDDAETVVAHGTAISPRDAARCLLDMARTSRYLQGVVAGIEEARRRFPGQVIEILYAGCGPYATLAIPVCARYSLAEVRFTLLDIHRRSLVAARAVVDGLGFSEYVREYVRCDATTYRHPADAPLHMVITEAMQRALAKEPQLAITANLGPQLHPGGVHIPERITVDLALADLAREFSLSDASASDAPAAVRDRIPVARLLDVSASSIGPLLRSAGDDASLPPVVVRIPRLDEESSYSVMLRTTIRVFGDIELGEYDSGLTYPVILHDLGTVRGGETLELRYHLGRTPGFRHRNL